MSPPVTTTSLSTKSVEVLLSVNEMVAVSLINTLVTLLETVTSGATVLTVRVLSLCAALSFPASSANAPAPTATVAVPLKSASGVKTAV